jgi:hypothetical protein
MADCVLEHERPTARARRSNEIDVSIRSRENYVLVRDDSSNRVSDIATNQLAVCTPAAAADNVFNIALETFTVSSSYHSNSSAATQDEVVPDPISAQGAPNLSNQPKTDSVNSESNGIYLVVVADDKTLKPSTSANVRKIYNQLLADDVTEVRYSGLIRTISSEQNEDFFSYDNTAADDYGIASEVKYCQQF